MCAGGACALLALLRLVVRGRARGVRVEDGELANSRL